MNKTLLVVLALIMLTGCAPTMYCHPTKDASQFESDKYNCENIGFAKAHQFGASGNPFIIADEMRRCLQLKHGWKPCNQ
jgi:outer membrane biogenesis lipoprotein LolB